MRKYSPQEWTAFAVRILITVLFFLVSAVPFYGLSPRAYNYTGLLNERPAITVFCMGPLGLIYTRIFYREGCRLFGKKDWLPKTVLLFALAVLVMLLPYGEKEDFFSGLHVAFAYLTLIVYGWLMSLLLFQRKPLFTLFFMGMTLCFFLSLTALSVTGTAELVFSLMNALIFSFLLPLPEIKNSDI